MKDFQDFTTTTLPWIDEHPPLPRAQVLSLFQTRRVLKNRIESILDSEPLSILRTICSECGEGTHSRNSLFNLLVRAKTISDIPEISQEEFRNYWGMTQGELDAVYAQLHDLNEQINHLTKTIISHNARLIVYIIRAYYQPSNRITYLELFAEGVRGCFRAIQLFDPNVGIAFSTFAFPHIRSQISRAISRQTKSVPAGSELPLFDSEGSTEGNPEHDLQLRLENLEFIRMVEEAVAEMEPRYSAIVTEHLGPNGSSPDELAQKFGITRRRVFQLREEGLELLRRILSTKFPLFFPEDGQLEHK